MILSCFYLICCCFCLKLLWINDVVVIEVEYDLGSVFELLQINKFLFIIHKFVKIVYEKNNLWI